MVDQHWIRAWSITGGAAAAVIGTFLPWLRSGSVDRSSHEMLDLVERLGFTSGGLVEWAIRLWPLVPLLFVVGAVVQWNTSVRPAMVWARRLAPLVPSVYATTVALALALAPQRGVVSVRYGVPVTAAASTIVLLATVWPVRRPGSGASAGA